MKKLFTLIMSMIAATAAASDFEFKLDGHMSAEFVTNQDPVKNSLHLGDVGFVFRPIITLQKDEFGFVIESDLTQVAVEDSGWLKAAFLKYSPSEDWDFQLGRIPLSAIMLTQPGRFLETVQYQHCPIGIYAYGARVTNRSGNWTTMWDMNLGSSVSFQSSDAFNGLETGLRTEYRWNECWTTAGNVVYDIDGSNVFGALDINYTQGAFGLHAVGYGNDENVYGLYSLAKYRVCTPLELHVGLDWEDGGKFSEILGVRLFAGEKTDITLDYTFTTNKDNEFGLRLRHRF